MKIFKWALSVTLVIGHLCGSLSPTLARADDTYTADVTLVVKSFIAWISDSQIGFEDSSAIERDRAKVIADIANYSASSDPQTPSETPRDYRVWSSKEIKIECSGDRLLSMTASRLQTDKGSDKLGLGMSIPAENGIVLYDDAVEKDGKVDFTYKVQGRPAIITDIPADLVRPRTSVYAWQQITGTLSCAPGTATGYDLSFNFLGSSFPSHRIWENGKLIRTIPQGDFEDLWEPSPADPQKIE